jgi:hypothetical protein
MLAIESTKDLVESTANWAVLRIFLTLFCLFNVSFSFSLSSKVLFIASSLALKLEFKVNNVLSSLVPSWTFNLASSIKASFLILSFSSCNFLSSSIANKEASFCSLLTLSIKFCSAFNLLSSSVLSLLASLSASFSSWVSFFSFITDLDFSDSSTCFILLDNSNFSLAVCFSSKIAFSSTASLNSLTVSFLKSRITLPVSEKVLSNDLKVSSVNSSTVFLESEKVLFTILGISLKSLFTTDLIILPKPLKPSAITFTFVSMDFITVSTTKPKILKPFTIVVINVLIPPK